MTNRVAIAIPNAHREMVPAQVREPSMAPLSAEKRLMLAVLERAVDDFRTYAIVPTGRGRWLFREVAAWFDSSETGPFDFEGICRRPNWILTSSGRVCVVGTTCSNGTRLPEMPWLSDRATRRSTR